MILIIVFLSVDSLLKKMGPTTKNVPHLKAQFFHTCRRLLLVTESDIQLHDQETPDLLKWNFFIWHKNWLPYHNTSCYIHKLYSILEF